MIYFFEMCFFVVMRRLRAMPCSWLPSWLVQLAAAAAGCSSLPPSCGRTEVKDQAAHDHALVSNLFGMLRQVCLGPFRDL